MYKADILNTSIKNGVLNVDVLFHSNEDSFQDSFNTNQYQNDSWIGEQIERRLSHLNSLSTVRDSITIGPYHEVIKVKSEKDIYNEKTSLYLNYMNIARTGVILHDREIIVELRNWLRENFKDEYVLENF